MPRQEMMKTAKDEARKILERLPDDTSWEEIQHRIQTHSGNDLRPRSGSNPSYLLIAFGIAMLIHVIGAGYSRRYAFLDVSPGWTARTGTPRLTLDRYRETPTVVENSLAPPVAPRPDRARLASDRNSPARDRSAQRLARTETPASPGQVADAYNLVAGGGRGGQGGGKRAQEAPVEGPQNGRPVSEEQGSAKEKGRDFASYLKRGEERGREMAGPGSGGSALFRNDRGGAMAGGDLSFSTYAWDFAPYMLKLKALIESHMYPPPAFSVFGIIDGKNVVRFRIGRDGKLLGMEALGYEGSKLLVETSTQALDLSNPFPPLPPDFPDAYLEVTGQFRYDLIRGGR